MSESTTLDAFINSLPEASSPSGLCLILKDSSGKLHTIKDGITPFWIFQVSNCNADDLTIPGIYKMTSGTGFPNSGNGNLCIVLSGADGIYQKYIRFGAGGQSYHRYKINNVWGNWIQEA